jgi:Ca2+/Na+ antiporter
MRGESIESSMFSHEITRNEIIASYVASAVFPLLGIPLSLYFLVKGRIYHFIGIAIVSFFMFILWVIFYYRYSSRITMIGSLIS